MKQKVLIDLDSLLDTRLALMSLIKPEYAEAVVSNPDVFEKYANRLNDNIPELDIHDGNLLELYRERKSFILPISLATALAYELIHIVRELIEASFLEPHRVESIELDINLFPYVDLTEDEERAIVTAISHMCENLAEVKAVYIDPKVMSPSFFNSSEYVAYFTYDLGYYLLCHYNTEGVDIETLQMPSFTIVAPFQATSVEALKKAVEFQAPNGDQIDIRDGYAFMYKDFFKLDLTDIGLFSLASPGLISSQLQLE